MKFTKTIKQKGFTLIELLVVISIISLLSSVVLAAVNSAREKAQYSKFSQELQNLTLAIELYKANNNNNYPNSMADYANIDDTVTLLNSLGLFGSDTIKLPSGVFSYEFYTVNDGSLVTCGSADPSENTWAIGIDVQYGDPQIPGFSSMYSNGSLVPNYKCIEITI